MAKRKRERVNLNDRKKEEKPKSDKCRHCKGNGTIMTTVNGISQRVRCFCQGGMK